MNWNNFISKQKIYIIIASAIIIILLAVFGVLKYFNKSVSQINQLPKLIAQESQEMNLMEGKSAIELGLAAARQWHSDAELSYVFSADAGQLTGRSNNWQLIYISPSNKYKGFQVLITDAKISAASEIPYSGDAAQFPADAISQDEAVAKVKAIPGFANVKILAIEMIYSSEVKTWYWGVRTDKGTASIVAARENK
jgi:hypothetical protein